MGLFSSSLMVKLIYYDYLFIFLQFGKPLSIKCYAVPDTRKSTIVFQTDNRIAVVSQLQKMGNGLFLHPTKPAHKLASRALNSLGFLRAKVLPPERSRKEVLHERPSAGWVKNLAL